MKNLIVYFSYSNNTKNLVEKINKEFNFEVLRVSRIPKYSDDYDTCAYKEAKEEVDKRLFPKINNLDIERINSFDQILLFFPIWWYTFPMPIATFINELKGYKGKIIVFANSYTNDYNYMRNSMNDFKKIDSNINFIEGLLNKSSKEHIDFIKKINGDKQ